MDVPDYNDISVARTGSCRIRTTFGIYEQLLYFRLWAQGKSFEDRLLHIPRADSQQQLGEPGASRPLADMEPPASLHQSDSSCSPL